MPCPIKGKLLSSIEAGIHPALKYDFGNSSKMSDPPDHIFFIQQSCGYDSLAIPLEL
jgi:hypothetical protein